MQTFFVATALLLVGAARAFGDFDRGNPVTWLYLLGLLAADAALLLLYRSMETQAADSKPDQAPAVATAVQPSAPARD